MSQKKTVNRHAEFKRISVSEEKQSNEIRELFGGSRTGTGTDREKFISKQSEEMMKSI